MLGISGQVVIVVGGASGIGKATALRFADLGADVAILDIQDVAGDVVRAIEERGRRAFFRRTDITDFDAVKQSVQGVITTLGKIDSLANVAGWNEHSFFMQQDPAFWHKVININMWGQIHTARAVLDHMVERRKGSIVTVASDAGRVGTNGETIYSVAKGGIIAFTKSLSREVTRFGIRVNCVSPGPTQTPMMTATMEHQPKLIEKMNSLIPMRRVAQPEEQAEAIVFLASDSASFITGQTLSVNGGLNML
jgi:NAD(P)-dependent dehydrogenase (short-subunit alcohol dehydrogenase family)